MWNKKIIFKLFKIGVVGVVLLGIVIFISNQIVEYTANEKLYNSTENIPYNRVGLLLGTIKTLKNGKSNLYYKYRINATVALYEAGKISRVLVSGDNGNKNYDEPTDMKNDLIANGIPAEHIVLDYAGFRTLDSIVRCRDVFGQDSVTIISQAFHNKRALFIAKYSGIDAIGYNANTVATRYSIRIQLREYLARVKMIVDIAFGKKPKFLGEKITIE